MAQRITPCLWLGSSAREAVDFYVSVLPDAEVTHVSRYPTEGLPAFLEGFAGRELEFRFATRGFGLAAIHAGDNVEITPSVSMLLNFDPSAEALAAERLDSLWDRLVDGGTVLMELGAYDFSPRYGWVRDRYGMTWQLMLSDPAGEPRPFIVPMLLFTGEQPRAEEAVRHYTSLLPGSSRGTLLHFPEGTGRAADAVMFADFQLDGQWFAAMDGGSGHDFTFSEGVSLEVACADQAEIDRVWEGLSAVPEAERCGWCQDRFGLRWQVVPSNLGDLLATPGAWQAMMGMGRLVIAGL